MESFKLSFKKSSSKEYERTNIGYWKHPRYRFDQNRVAQGNVFKKIRKERGKRTETYNNGVTE